MMPKFTMSMIILVISMLHISVAKAKYWLIHDIIMSEQFYMTHVFQKNGEIKYYAIIITVITLWILCLVLCKCSKAVKMSCTKSNALHVC